MKQIDRKLNISWRGQALESNSQSRTKGVRVHEDRYDDIFSDGWSLRLEPIA